MKKRTAAIKQKRVVEKRSKIGINFVGKLFILLIKNFIQMQP